MAIGEFDLIDRYFRRQQELESVELGIGDDCALLRVPADKLLAVSMDTLVADVHFPADAAPEDIAQRALRVNLSDLAAVGAEPLWFTLGLTLPHQDHQWLNDFSRGLFSAAREFNVALVGGDTTRGPLTISIQVHGAVANRAALRRDGARVGDAIFVSGSLGDGAAGLKVLQQDELSESNASMYFLERFYRPRPHLKEGRLLSGLASAALDVSDGLLADLEHICEASGVAARINIEKLPLSEPMKQWIDGGVVDEAQARQWALSGGDDYRLCFTVPENKRAQLLALQQKHRLNFQCIGEITRGEGVICLDAGRTVTPSEKGYNHFDH
ncbi:MAG: thiamine-phosphate kinase [Pseudomonadota bacterium]